jgi:uncharacterized protein (TIGR01319 family)
MIGLIDIGSTFTKVCIVDTSQKKVVCTTQSPSTVSENVMIGVKDALNKAAEEGVYLDRVHRYLACSSAAGGLRVVAIGFVPDITGQAARKAALGAGAKIVRTFAFELTLEDLQEIERLSPDIILLAGGTDGGNKKNIVGNARKLSTLREPIPIVMAGNRNAVDEVSEIFLDKPNCLVVTENVLPEFDKLNVAPAQRMITELFIKRIVEAKGLTEVQKLLNRPIIPTPSAVLRACEILSKGTSAEPGLGPLVIVDIGGATTDVHSAADGDPSRTGVLRKGIPEPYLARTVEGDLGVRYNALSILELLGEERLRLNLDQEILDLYGPLEIRSTDVTFLPFSSEERFIDKAIAISAIQEALVRHAGHLERIYSVDGEILVQYGKDLTEVSHLIGTGGVLVHSGNGYEILERALRILDPLSLAPKKARVVIDNEYVLYAIGLLALEDPQTALEIGKNTLVDKKEM